MRGDGRTHRHGAGVLTICSWAAHGVAWPGDLLLSPPGHPQQFVTSPPIFTQPQARPDVGFLARSVHGVCVLVWDPPKRVRSGPGLRGLGRRH